MRWAGWWLGPLLGVLSACAVFVLLARIWASCHIGTPSINGGVLTFVDAPEAFLITSVLTGLTYALLYRIPVKGRTVLAVFGAVVVAVAVIWITVSVKHNPGGDYPSPWCVDNVPAWFPSWIPL